MAVTLGMTAWCLMMAGQKEVRKAMSEKEKKEIAEMVETAKHLATHDPRAFMIAKSNMEILKIRADMDKQEKEPA